MLRRTHKWHDGLVDRHGEFAIGFAIGGLIGYPILLAIIILRATGHAL